MIDMRKATESELLTAMKFRLTLLNKHTLDVACEIGRVQQEPDMRLYGMLDFQVSQTETVMAEIRFITDELKRRTEEK